MWIDGVNPVDVLGAYVAAFTALAVFGVIAARQQQAYSPIVADASPNARVDGTRLGIVACILVVAVLANVVANLKFPTVLDHFPVIGVAVWVAILLTAGLRKPDWSLLPNALRGSIFLLSLVCIASLMPVEHLPKASWQTAFGLGFVSAVFDNIPLTALALKQGGFDWGMLAYCVGFGGSMIWFGSSAGVALASMFPEARSVGQWLRHGWHVALAYVIGFFVMLAVSGWHPLPKRVKADAGTPPVLTAPAVTTPAVTTPSVTVPSVTTPKAAATAVDSPAEDALKNGYR
jgi:hypothetical protein